MKRYSLIILSLAAAIGSASAQDIAQAFKGYPSAEGAIDIKQYFADPPKGYGNVPFYWWTGDSLNIERLKYELDIMAEAPTDGFSVSYNHTDYKTDLEANASGFGSCGVPDPGCPYAFSEGWWKIWNEFSALCAEKGIGLGMDDYVFMWPGNKCQMDEVFSSAEMAGYQGRLVRRTLPKDAPLPENTLVSEPAGDSVIVISTTADPTLHPRIGEIMIKTYFQPFVDHCDAEGLKGMNYFFQDELIYKPSLTSWCEDMREEFLKRKGYDIVPLLPLLYKDPEGDSLAVKTRLDYAEVVTQLAEERYFKPVFDWHHSRGLIYGCDNMGRGLEPTQYMDYFRAISWFTAPGNDAPARGSSFIQTKVSSSVSHLYQRPRTWLEAFHSMGWDANGALLTYQLDHHLIAGGNLLCMHGMYYSTHGSWWEWAPPSFHFRMPYWPHMKKWLEYAERMCFVLSQGRHVCDVAILYPTETLQVYPGADPDATFRTADTLSRSGIDFDFIDYQSLQNAVCENGELKVAGESYKALVLSGIRAMHAETAAAISRFKAAGGIVIDTDALGGEDIVQLLHSSFAPDFKSRSGAGRVLHRRVGERDVYMVMDVKEGDEMTFRACGKAELWDAFKGTVRDLGVLSSEDGLTRVRFDGKTGSSQLIVFSPGEPVLADAKPCAAGVVSRIPLEGEWDVEIVPTLDNRWGDFRLPASDEFIGVEARSMHYAFIPGKAPKGFFAVQEALRESTGESVVGYAPYMMTSASKEGPWTPYEWSWQYGVFDSPGSQGYHGLKGKVHPGFLILDQGGERHFKTCFLVPSKGEYSLVKTGMEPSVVEIDGAPVGGPSVKLGKGWHDLYLRFDDTKKSEYALEKLVCWTRDLRDRSMVVILPADAPECAAKVLYEDIVCSKWYESSKLPFDPYGARKGFWAYSFETAPGASELSFDAEGPVAKMWVDGESLAFKQKGSRVTASLPAKGGVSEVTLLAQSVAGCPGTAFFDTPVKISCSRGKMEAGDWTEVGAMKWFSGGVRYSKTFEVGECGAGQKWVLDLGEVDATCEVSVNGSPSEVLLCKPYSLDITDLVREGTNTVEVLVYSSLSNHYGTSPSPYKGKPRSGLIGPVSVSVTTGGALGR